MNIVKPLKELNSQPSRKRPYSNVIRYVPAMLFASLIGTYLDLFFVGKGFYSFPLRPMSEIFSINLAFTLIGLPILIGIFLSFTRKLSFWNRALIICGLSLSMTAIEKTAEHFGLFIHDETWRHYYSLIGYALFLSLVSAFHRWIKIHT